MTLLKKSQYSSLDYNSHFKICSRLRLYKDVGGLRLTFKNNSGPKIVNKNEGLETTKNHKNYHAQNAE